jgi:hypothetical protein
MKDWQRIRQACTDLTDYVVHFTKMRVEPGAVIVQPFDVLCEILNAGYIRASLRQSRASRPEAHPSQCEDLTLQFVSRNNPYPLCSTLGNAPVDVTRDAALLITSTLCTRPEAVP